MYLSNKHAITYNKHTPRPQVGVGPRLSISFTRRSQSIGQSKGFLYSGRQVSGCGEQLRSKKLMVLVNQVVVNNR